MSGNENSSGDVKKCYCQICRATCGMLATISDDNVIRVAGNPDDPRSRGKLCPVGANSPSLVSAPDRLLHPLMRGSNGFEQVGWDRALDDISDRLASIRDESGPGSVVFYSGFTHRPINHAMMSLFSNSFGTPNLCGSASLCVSAKIMSCIHTFGPPRVPWSDFRNARCIMLLGANPAVSTMHRHQHVIDDIEYARAGGAKFIVVDPRLSEAARNADMYLQIRPGTDLALVLAMINVVITEGLHDAEFVENHTIGFDQLAMRVAEYTPQWAAGITGLDAGDIEQAARLFATTKPASLDRREGVQHHVNGYQTIRAINCLIAITGNVDREGGLLFNPGYPIANLSRKDLVEGKPVWAERFPLAPDAVSTLPNEILAGNIRAMVVIGGNPAVTYPNNSKVTRALDSLDLLVVHDLFMTETAGHAHYVLPAASFFEKLEVDGGRTERLRYLTESPALVTPRGESWPEWKLFCELGKRMGFDGFDFSGADEIADRLLSGMDFPRDRLTEASMDDVAPGWLRAAGFKTPSGRVEIYSEMLSDHGYDPLPAYVEPSESPVSRPDLAREYPLVLTTGARLPWFVHSQMHNIIELHRNAPAAPLEIDSGTAQSLGISDGDNVVVETARGSADAVAIYSEIEPGTVSMAHGFPGTGNVNLLTDDEQLDPVCATPAYRSLLCRVRQA